MYVFMFFKQTKERMNETKTLSLLIPLQNTTNYFSFQEIKEFVQSSGEDGFVILILGSVVENLPEERSNMIVSTLAQIPITFVLNSYLNESL